MLKCPKYVKLWLMLLQNICNKSSIDTEKNTKNTHRRIIADTAAFIRMLLKNNSTVYMLYLCYEVLNQLILI